MNELQAEQRKFMEACELDVSDTPVYDADRVSLWSMLIMEEHKELQEALDNMTMYNLDADQFYTNMSEVCAEAVDLVYVVMGLMNAMGLPFQEMFDEIHSANMRKVVNGKVLKNQNGKVIKPDSWFPADKLRILVEAYSR